MQGGSLLALRLVGAAGTPAGSWAAAGALLLVALVPLRLRPGTPDRRRRVHRPRRG